MTRPKDEAPERPWASRDRPLDPWRIPRTLRSHALLDEAARLVATQEQTIAPRQRQRRAKDAEGFQGMLQAILCDAVHLYLTTPERRLALSLDNNRLGGSGRYRHPAFGKGLSHLLEVLSAPQVALVGLEKGTRGAGHHQGQQTTIWPGHRLANWIERANLGLDDLSRAPREELIILKGPKMAAAECWQDRSGPRLDYEDSPETLAMRQRVQAINAFLAAAEITFDPWAAEGGRVVDDTDRHLRRYFNAAEDPEVNPWSRGGRLFGGFWQPLRKHERRRGIRINGEEVVTLDYGQMAPRLLYARLGQPMPLRDAYAIPGLLGHRSGVKKVFNSALFVTERLRRFPKGTAELFPKWTRVDHVVEALLSAHPTLSGHLFTGLGFELMHDESDILLNVLDRLRTAGVVALPIHDAVIVQASNAVIAQRAMREAFRAYADQEIPVEVDHGDFTPSSTSASKGLADDHLSLC